MTRTTSVSCDWCETEEQFGDDDFPVEEGWIEVAEYDDVKEDVVHRDFCTRECLVRYYD